MKTIVKMEFGSRLYGTQTPDSDTDYKEIYVPEISELILGTAKHNITNTTGGESKNTKNDIDHDIISVQKFIKDCLKGETFAIDMLHCEKPISSSVVWEKIVENRKRFYTKSMSSYVSYCRQQASKYGIKGSRLSEIKSVIEVVRGGNLFGCKTLKDIEGLLPVGEYVNFVERKHPKTEVLECFYEVNGKLYALNNDLGYVLDRLTLMYDGYGARAKLAEKNEGVDFKAMHHSLRAGYQARSIYVKGDFKYPLDETDYLMEVKRGKVHFKEIAQELERLVDEVSLLAEESSLPEESDKKFWDDFILNEVYGI